MKDSYDMFGCVLSQLKSSEPYILSCVEKASALSLRYSMDNFEGSSWYLLIQKAALLIDFEQFGTGRGPWGSG